MDTVMVSRKSEKRLRKTYARIVDVMLNQCHCEAATEYIYDVAENAKACLADVHPDLYEVFLLLAEQRPEDEACPKLNLDKRLSARKISDAILDVQLNAARRVMYLLHVD